MRIISTTLIPALITIAHFSTPADAKVTFKGNGAEISVATGLAIQRMSAGWRDIGTLGPDEDIFSVRRMSVANGKPVVTLARCKVKSQDRSRDFTFGCSPAKDPSKIEISHCKCHGGFHIICNYEDLAVSGAFAPLDCARPLGNDAC